MTSININIEQLKNTLSSVELSISSLGNEIPSLKTTLDRCLSDISVQQSNNHEISSKIENVSKSIESFADAINSFKGRINNVISKNQSLSRDITNQNKLVKKIMPRTAKQSLEIKKLGSSLKKSQNEVKNLRNLLNRKLSLIKRADDKLESTIKQQRKRIVELNKKLDVKKSVGKQVIKKSARATIKGKTAPKKASPKKSLPRISVKRRRAQDKTIITVKTPGKTLVEAVTPTKKKTVGVFREKNPLI